MLVATLRHSLIEPPLRPKDLPIVNDERFDPAAIEVEAEKSDAADEKVIAYALHCRDYEAAVTAEDVLYRRLRLGQMNSARTEALLRRSPPRSKAANGRRMRRPKSPKPRKSSKPSK